LAGVLSGGRDRGFVVVEAVDLEAGPRLGQRDCRPAVATADLGGAGAGSGEAVGEAVDGRQPVGGKEVEEGGPVEVALGVVQGAHLLRDLQRFLGAPSRHPHGLGRGGRDREACEQHRSEVERIVGQRIERLGDQPRVLAAGDRYLPRHRARPDAQQRSGEQVRRAHVPRQVATGCEPCTRRVQITCEQQRVPPVDGQLGATRSIARRRLGGPPEQGGRLLVGDNSHRPASSHLPVLRCGVGMIHTRMARRTAE
jgi:hypothetical protein